MWFKYRIIKITKSYFSLFHFWIVQKIQLKYLFKIKKLFSTFPWTSQHALVWHTLDIVYLLNFGHCVLIELWALCTYWTLDIVYLLNFGHCVLIELSTLCTYWTLDIVYLLNFGHCVVIRNFMYSNVSEKSHLTLENVIV